MSTKRTIAFWELCRQGLPLIADAANDAWSHGKAFRLSSEIKVARSLKDLIEQCNWEVERPAGSR